MVVPTAGNQTKTENITMFPVGTEVTYRNHHGWIKFCDPETGSCSICVRVFPEDPARNVCLVVYKHDLDHVIPIVGNHNRSDDY